MIENKNGWRHVCIPMIAEEDETWVYEKLGQQVTHHREKGAVLQPEREDLESVLLRKSRVGAYIFDSQFQQNPSPRDGNVIKKEWIRRYDLEDANRIPCNAILISCDPAAKDGPKNDYTAICVYLIIEGQQRTMFLHHVYRKKLTYGALKALILKIQEKYRSEFNAPVFTVIEDTMSGTPLLQELRELDSKIFAASIKSQTKYERLMNSSLAFEHGNIYHPYDASWLKDYEKELLSFPNGRYDDQVDATSQAILFKTKFKYFFQSCAGVDVMFQGEMRNCALDEYIENSFNYENWKKEQEVEEEEEPYYGDDPDT